MPPPQAPPEPPPQFGAPPPPPGSPPGGPPVYQYGQADPYAYAQPAQQPAYGQSYPVSQDKGTNTMAILALVLALVFAPAGIVCGHLARRQIKQTGEQGSGLATAGLWIGYILTGLYLLACCGVIAAAIFAGNNTTNY
jgi:hypothetical protein